MSGSISSIFSAAPKDQSKVLSAAEAIELAAATLGPIDEHTRATITAAVKAFECGREPAPGSSVAQVPHEVYATDYVARVFRKSMNVTPENDDLNRIAEFQIHAAELLRQAQPRDAMEQMLVAQMIWAYGRAAYYSQRGAHQINAKWAQLYLTAAERATNQYCRAMKTLTDYRRPPRRPASFTAIKRANIESANIAQQQVNVTTAEAETAADDNAITADA
jgi:hypothetical protein